MKGCYQRAAVSGSGSCEERYTILVNGSGECWGVSGCVQSLRLCGVSRLWRPRGIFLLSLTGQDVESEFDLADANVIQSDRDETR